MSSSDLVEIVVYDAPTAKKSGCDCGCDHQHDHGHGHHHGDSFDKITTEMQTRALALTLERAFPGKVKVEYINVLQDPRGPSLPQTKLLGSLTYPPPLVYVNGQGRFAGSLPVERIREEVEKILAAESN